MAREFDRVCAREENTTKATACQKSAVTVALETRCYALTGAASVLDSIEEILRAIERIGTTGATRELRVIVEDATVRVRVLASWIGDAETTGEEGE